MELAHINYVGMEITAGVKETLVVKNVLIVVDHFRLLLLRTILSYNGKSTALQIPLGGF